MNKKKDELNLKGPDAFQVRAAESVEFARKNSGPIYAAVGVAAVLALLAFGYQQFQESSV